MASNRRAQSGPNSSRWLQYNRPCIAFDRAFSILITVITSVDVTVRMRTAIPLILGVVNDGSVPSHQSTTAGLLLQRLRQGSTLDFTAKTAKLHFSWFVWCKRGHANSELPHSVVFVTATLSPPTAEHGLA